jgi:peptidyl-prolyl cis-trans isomerase SurA
MKKIKTIILLLIIIPTNLLFSQQKEKVIDKVIAVVGENAILYSDIENQYLQYIMQGYTANSQDIRCQIFEETMFAKLLLNQAQIDSIEIGEEQVESEMDRRLQYFISQIGSKEELERYYNKSLVEIKNDLRDVIREQVLTQQVRSEITSGITITPSEVQAFFKKIPADSLPLIETEIQYAVITKKPELSAEEKAYAYEKIKGIRERIMKGEDFATLARIYSEDPGSALKGGELGDFTYNVMYPEFEAAAFALQENEVSPIVETEAGFHILKLIKRKGEYINVRHILIQNKISPLSIERAKVTMDSIYQLIESGKMSFNEAATKFSDDDYAAVGGLAVNQAKGNNNFTPTEISKELYFKLEKMSVGAVSKPILLKNEENNIEIKMVKLIRRTKPHRANLQSDYDKIQESALQEKQMDAVTEWINKRTKDTYIVILDPSFKTCNFLYNWIVE